MINYSVTIVFYNLYFGFYVPYAIDIANQTRLGISDDQKDELIELKKKWDDAFTNYTGPETYGKLSIAVQTKVYRMCKLVTDGLTQQLKTSKSITLEELDFIIFNIHKDASKGKIPKPTAIASVVQRLVSHLNNEYQASNVADPTSGAKPFQVKRLKIVMLVLDAKAAIPTIDMLKPEMESGSMRFDIPFTEDQIGMIAYIAVCFSNDAGDGEYSAIIASPII